MADQTSSGQVEMMRVCVASLCLFDLPTMSGHALYKPARKDLISDHDVLNWIQVWESSVAFESNGFPKHYWPAATLVMLDDVAGSVTFSTASPDSTSVKSEPVWACLLVLMFSGKYLPVALF